MVNCKKYLIFFKFLFIVFIYSLVNQCKSIDSNKVIILQPFEKFSDDELNKLYKQFTGISSKVYINPSIPLPKNAYNQKRNRYRADSLIKFLRGRVKNDTVIIGITNKDISTSKGKINDWGVMGLGYRPGKSCIVSTYRLNKKQLSEQLYKVTAHEFGHTQGLDHCPDKSCIMRDAEGRNPLNEENEFCPKCKSYLINKGFFAVTEKK